MTIPSLGEHAVQCAVFAAVLSGPVPLARALLRALARERAALSLPERILVAIVAWCALQVALMLGLGALSLMRLPFVLAVEAAMFAGGVATLRRLRLSSSVDGVDDFPPRLPGSLLERSFIALLGLGAIAALLSCVRHPVSDFDGLAYHGPAILEWHHQGRLGALPFPPQLGLQRSFSYGWEMLGILCVMPFDSDLMIAAPSPLAWFTLGLATYVLATAFGAGRAWSAIAGCLVAFAPFVRFHATTLYVDIAFAAFLVASIALAKRAGDSPVITGVALAATGLAASLKAVALVYVSFPLGLLAVSLLRSRRDGATAPWSPGGARRSILAAGGGLLVFVGGFWSVRNFILTGNPLGFVTVRLGDLVIFEGSLSSLQLRSTSVLRLLDPADPAHLKAALLALQAQFGPLMLLIAAGIVLAPPLVVLGRRNRAGTATLLAIGAAIAWLYASTPWSGGSGSVFEPSVFRDSTRFGFALFAVLAALAAVALSSWTTGPLPAVPTSVESRWPPLSRRGVALVALAAVMLFTVVSAGLFRLRVARETERDAESGGVSTYIRSSIPRDEAIAYGYGLYGLFAWAGDASRNVVLLPNAASTEETLRELERRGIRHVVTGPPLSPAERERQEEWAAGSRPPIVHVMGQPGALVLFRLDRPVDGVGARSR